MFSSLVISLILIIIGGSSSDFVLHLSYWTVLISAWGELHSFHSPPHPSGSGGEEEGGWGGVIEQLRGSELLAGLELRHMG